MSGAVETGAPPAPAPDPGFSISREELHALPVRRYDGPIHLIDRDDDVAAACAALRRETLLGFDTETRPSFRVGESHPPALVQLAAADAAYIFQIRNLRDLQPLLDLLADGSIVKAGVALADDLKKLRHVHPFEPAGFIDIGHLARKQGFKQTGLRTLAGMLLGFRLSKREQRSNWGLRTLSRGQIVYAATDAWVGRELYINLAAPGP